MPVTPTQAVLLVALALAVGTAWYVDGRGRWRVAAADRLRYGVPWGTGIAVAVVVGFYLFAQGGLRHWDDPVALAFVTWSYFYPTGMLTSGIAHASPEHLLSNVTATVVFGAIAEYVWGHYAPAPRSGDGAAPQTREAGTPTAEPGGDPSDRPDRRTDGGARDLAGRPWVRVGAFSAALLAVAFLTAAFSLGPALGFSGAVFALVGFAVVAAPLAAVVAVVVSVALSVLLDALLEPVVRETVSVGPPVPPDWASIAFQAHLLGFLIGAVAAVALLSRRGRRPSFAAPAFGVLAVGMVQALWLLVWPGGVDEYVLYRGIGAVVVVALALVIAGAAAGSDRRLPRPLARFDRVPSRRTLALGWLGLLALGVLLLAAGIVAGGEVVGLSLALLAVLAALLAVPALPPVLPDRVFPSPVAWRHVAVVCLVAGTVLVAVVSVPFGLTVVGEEGMPDEGAVVAGDYAVTYAEGADSERDWVFDVGDEEDLEAADASGVVVVSERREIWTVAVTEELLAFRGGANVTVGGVGWRETVRVERTGWDVLGNDTVYAVDLATAGEAGSTRAFAADPAAANAELDGRTFEVVPTDDGFGVAVEADGEAVGTAPIPEAGESTTVGDVSISTVDDGDATRVVAETDDARVQIAERETYH